VNLLGDRLVPHQTTPLDVRPRSPLFRALGADDPPDRVEIRGHGYHLETVFKHDSWAATGLYVSRAGKAVCKFNRRQDILGIPMQGLGRVLAKREIEVLRRLADVPNVPRWLGPVVCAGCRLPHAVARTYIPGRPLSPRDRLPGSFYDALARLLNVMHERRLAYVDLHKAENVLVGADGQPYLFDFQISFIGDPYQRQDAWTAPLLQLLQEADAYHLAKHRRRGAWRTAHMRQELPWFIRAHRLVGYPLRELRRRLLVVLGIRSGAGRASTELCPEDAVQRELDKTRRAA
jgi:hypothetical protein